MRKRVVKRILSTALAATMVIGNIGVPNGITKVEAAQVSLDGKTQVTDADISSLYHNVSYTAQAVHDPSVIKVGDEYYVFGSHRGVAKTANLTEWQSVNVDGLFGDSTGKILTPDEAFIANAFHGSIAVADSTGTADTLSMQEPINEGVAEKVLIEEDTTEESSVEESSAEESAPETEESSVEESAPETEESSVEESAPETENSVVEESVSETENSVVEESMPETENSSAEGASAEENVMEAVSAQAAAVDFEAAVQETVTDTVDVSQESSTETAEEESTQESTPEAAVEVEETTEEETTEAVETEEAEEELPEIFDNAATAAVQEKVSEAAESAAPVTDGSTGTITFGDFNAAAWNTASQGIEIGGNMWAPDIIYNPTMNKYCMYLSLNGAHQNSVIVLLTADEIEGPYVYQGPIVYTGFTAVETAAAGETGTTAAVATNWKNTDIKYVLGDVEELPERYKNVKSVTLNDNGKISGVDSDWGEYWPHAIDPTVFFDADGKLWMAYGSWHGGIYMLELDENTGLRDYTVTYSSDADEKGKSVTSDAYFGKKIAGGYYNSGEGPYIEKIGNYYYLFMSYGFYAPNGGYAMRIFRSENPDGPYVDTKGTSAIYDSGVRNYTSQYGAIQDTRGMRLMSFYQWDHMTKGEVAQGHNSAIEDADGRAYVIYHTKFNDNTADHALRVHELFQNKNGWIVASPFAFAQDSALNYSEEPTDVTGDYEIIVHTLELGFDKDSGDGRQDGNYTGPLEEIQTINLAADGTVTQNASPIGTWTLSSGTPYVDITLNGQTYSGVFAEVTKDSAGIKTMCFTAVDESTGVSLWGAKKLGDLAVIADNVKNPAYSVPTAAYASFTLPSAGSDGAQLYWTSSDTSIVGDDGTITAVPENDTDVTFTMTMVKGDYYYTKDYTIKIAGSSTISSDRILVGTAFTDDPQNLAAKNDGSLMISNPFNSSNTNGLEFSGGVSIEFDVKHNGTNVNVLGSLLGFQDNAAGKLYFTQGSYLGYNALGGWVDANLAKDENGAYILANDYIGAAITASGNETAHVEIQLNTDGFTVLVDNVKVYDQTVVGTDNGFGTLTDYSNILTWLQASATKLYLGYGAWWLDMNADATVSNLKFYVNKADDEKAVDAALAALEAQIPAETTANINLPTAGALSTTITWESSNPDVLAADGTVTLPDKETAVTLTATVTKGNVSKTKTFTVIVKRPATANAVLTKDLLEITDAGQIELIDNPFYGKNLEGLYVDYDIIMNAEAAKNGWDSIFAFYDTATTGRVSFQTNPYICYNKMGNPNSYLDINSPAANQVAGGWEAEREYNIHIELTKSECKMYVDGTAIGVALSGDADFEEVLSAVSQYDKFSWGCGNDNSATHTSFWGTELCTLKNIYISSNPITENVSEEVVLEAEPVSMDNPLYGENLKEVVLDFTANFSENAVLNGWDGLASFYADDVEGAGRVSLQVNPYLCFNDMAGTWMDMNQPGDGGDNVAPTLQKGTDYHFYVSITPSGVSVKIDGKAVSMEKEASSGGVSYQAILNYISTCKKFSWGVTEGTSSFWGMEKCTLKDAKVVGYSDKEYTGEAAQKVDVTFNYPDGTVKTQRVRVGTTLQKSQYVTDESGKTIVWYADSLYETPYDFSSKVTAAMSLYGRYEEEAAQKVDVTFYYPDGTVKTESVEKGTVLQQPEYAVDENGRDILWYTDGTYETLYDFSNAVTEAVSLYGRFYYYTEATGIRVSTIPDQQYTGAAIKPVITVYDGTTRLKEKADYKVSYKDNKKVGTATVTITPMGNYDKAKKVTTTFKIVPREINEANVTVSYKPELNVKYNSKKQVVGQAEKVTVKYGKLTVPAKEYTITYKKDGETVENLTEAGNYQMVIATKENSSFKGTLSYDIVVTDKILTSALKIKADAQDWNEESAKTEEGITTNITVTYKGKSVVPEGKSVSDIFDITYENNKNAGTASVTLKAKSDSEYCGSRTVTFKINGTAIKKAAIVGFQSKVGFTGEEIKQNVTLVLNKGKTTERTLTENDYTIVYSNSVNAGKATMLITGTGEFTGTVKKTFTIEKVNLAKAAEKDISIAFAEAAESGFTVVQDKSGAKPEVNVTYKGTALTEGKDYSVSYSANKAVGTGKVTVKGIGNYTGTLKNVLTFKITEKDINDLSVTVTAADLKYKANGRYKASVTVLDNGVKLSSKEYTVGAVENVVITKSEDGEETQCGTAQVTITGKKNYNGAKTVTVQIRKNLVSSAKITVEGKYYYDNGKEVCPPSDKVTVTIGSGKKKVTLTEGKDYTIVGCDNNTKAGNATLTIQGIGEYGGTKTVKYKILPKWMKLD